jgi:hypothetical protein
MIVAFSVSSQAIRASFPLPGDCESLRVASPATVLLAPVVNSCCSSRRLSWSSGSADSAGLRLPALRYLGPIGSSLRS